MINIASSIDKLTIPAMPTVVFPGEIKVIDNMDDAREAVRLLSMEKRIGFDTETRPSFSRSVSYKIALLQLSTLDTAYLFRLNIIGLPDFLVELLSDPDVVKIGLSVRDDFHSLRKRNPDMAPASFLELQSYVAEIGIEEKGLQRLYALLFGQRISKGQQLSNWEAAQLSPAQRSYGAIDAWACLVIYNYLEKLRSNGDFTVFKRYEESYTEEG